MYTLVWRLVRSSSAGAVSMMQSVHGKLPAWRVQACNMHLQRQTRTAAVQHSREASSTWPRNRRAQYNQQEQGNLRTEEDLNRRSRHRKEQLDEEEDEEAEHARPQHTGQRFFVTCHPGLESAVAQELSDLGMEGVQEGKAGVSFWGSTVADGYLATLWLRSAIRVLAQLGEGKLETVPGVPGRRGADTLYEVVRSCGVRWQEVIPPGATFSIEPRLWSCTDINSTQLMWQRIKDAICDAVSDARGERPLPPPPGTVADVPLYCSAYQDHLVIYRDLSGQSLHRRGYRDVMHRSPLNEAAAAGMLLLGGWPDICQQEGSVLVDPMCGSGTLLLEAALMARNIAPGLSRDPKSWPFVRWPDFQPKAWKEAWQEARDARRPWQGMLYGNDIHPGALSLAMRDMKRAELQPISRLHSGDCRTWELPEAPSLVAVNPPWGRRIGQTQGPGPSRGDGGPDDEVHEAWMSLSTFLRSQCGGARALVISGNKEALNVLRMRPSRKHKLTVGGVEAHLYEYQVLPPKQQQQQQAPS